MKALRRIFHFLGGITFALILLTLTAIVVIVGTFIESFTDSHRYAAAFTYSSPLFALLLWGFFVNILTSALRRWPFKVRHIPFLITHFGLLMIIGGCLIKNSYGIQGNLAIMEGSGGHHIHRSDTYSVTVERRDPEMPQRILAKHYGITRPAFGGPLVLIPNEDESLSFSDLQLEYLDCLPHCSEQWDTWFKGDYAYIYGIPPFPVKRVESESISPLPEANVTMLSQDDPRPWRLYALRSDNVLDTVRTILGANLEILVINPITKKIRSTILLDDALSGNPDITAELSLEPNFDLENTPATLRLKVKNSDLTSITPLSGVRALEEQSPYLLHPERELQTVALQAKPTIAFIEDEEGDILYLTLSRNGRITLKRFTEGKSDSLLVYDEGFGGYSVHTPLPDPKEELTTREVELAKIYNVSLSLRDAMTSGGRLASPLELLREGCQKAGTDFVETLVLFLDALKQSGRYVMTEDIPLPASVSHALSNVDWSSVDKAQLKGCVWGHYLLNEVQESMMNGKSFMEALEELNWPLAERFTSTIATQPDHDLKILSDTLLQQIYLVANQLPEVTLPEKISPPISGALLSTSLRLYAISLEGILPQLNDEALNVSKEKLVLASLFNEKLNIAFPPFRDMHLKQKISFIETLSDDHPFIETLKSTFKSHFHIDIQTVDTTTLSAFFPPLPIQLDENRQKTLAHAFNSEPRSLESMVMPRYQRQPPKTKLEDNVPLLILSAAKGNKAENIAVAFDPYGTRFKWPILNGEYRVRFQQKTEELPYHLRLRKARQVNYANSSQPFCYECDLLISDRRTGATVEKTLSMNNVYETKEGYRFYLANITPSEEGQVKTVQIVVNYDPAKYYLTYPGGVIVAIGIVSLFWMYSRRRKGTS